jgi:hypothetical protein
MKSLPRFLLLGAVMLQVGCGLPDTFFLQAPTVVTLATGTSNNFVFSNPIHDFNHDINVSFTGNELYYKFYADLNIDQNAYDSTNPNDPSVQLAAKGFFPLRLSTDTSSNQADPQIAIGTGLAQAGSTVTVTINGAIPASHSTYVITSGPTVEVRRNALDPNNFPYYKTFLDNNASPPSNYVPGSDVDVTSAITGPVAYVAMYAISFGYTGTSTPQRSVPVYLGYVSITPFP